MSREPWALDELDRVLGGERPRPPRASDSSGESDPFRAYSRRTIRSLIGGGWFARGGIGHDELADMIARAVPGCEHPDDAVAWYVHACRTAQNERRCERHRRQYRARDRRARELGFPSHWYHRLAVSS